MVRVLLPATLLLTLACSACGPAPEDPARRAQVQSGAEGDATAHAADNGTPGDVTARYACSDGSSITFAAHGEQATVQLPDGDSVTLPRAQSASKGSGDVFVGETISLQREGQSAALFLEGGERSNCQPADATE